MSKHLSDEQLLNDQFNLSSPADSQQVRNHLSECSECTRRANELGERFTAEDLKGEADVTEENIAAMLRAARTSGPKARQYPVFKAALYFTTAAAMTLFLAVVLMPSPQAIPPDLRTTIAERRAEQAAAPKVVSIARVAGVPTGALPTRPILGKTAVTVSTKPTRPPKGQQVSGEETHQHTPTCRCEVKTSPYAGVDIPMDRMFRPERETEEWKTLGETSSVKILSEPAKPTDSNLAVTAWQVTVKNLSDDPLNVSVVRPLLNPAWGDVRVAEDVVSVASAGDGNIGFELAVAPGATEAFIYEMHQ